MKKIGLLLLMVCLGGCASPLKPPPSVRGYNPELYVPPRPTLRKLTVEELTIYCKLPETLRWALETNNQALMIYAEQQAVTIDSYNAYARKQNGISDAALKIKPNLGDQKDAEIKKDGK